MVKRRQEHQGKTYLLTANWAQEPAEIEIELAAEQFHSPTVKLLPENKDISVQNGLFMDTWEPYGVRVYEITSTLLP
jgi:hypothetical protein